MNPWELCQEWERRVREQQAEREARRPQRTIEIQNALRYQREQRAEQRAQHTLAQQVIAIGYKALRRALRQDKDGLLRLNRVHRHLKTSV